MKALVLTGLAESGKSAIGAAVAEALSFEHIEMSAFVRARKTEDLGDVAANASTLQYLEGSLWPHEGRAVIAADAIAHAFRTGDRNGVVISGPRRQEEMWLLRSAPWNLAHVHLEASYETRAERYRWESALRPEAVLDNFEAREAAEQSWGITNFALQASTGVVSNESALPQSVNATLAAAERIWAGSQLATFETELRFLLRNVPATEAWLSRTSWRMVSKGQQIVDLYYLPKSVNTFAAHEEWLAGDDASPMRLRLTRVSGGKWGAHLEVKSPVVADLSMSREISLYVRDAAGAQALLGSLGYYCISAVSKTRRAWSSSLPFTVFVDRYSQGPDILELEATSGTAEKAANLLQVLRKELLENGWGEPLRAPVPLSKVRAALHDN